MSFELVMYCDRFVIDLKFKRTLSRKCLELIERKGIGLYNKNKAL